MSIHAIDSNSDLVTQAKIDLVARGSTIKLGKRLAVIEVSIYSDEDIVAHATGTYSIPPTLQP